MSKPLHFNAFVMNTASHIHHGQWRRPDARQHEFNDVQLWIDLARTLESAYFDSIFFADVSGLYGDSDADYTVYTHQGLQIPSNDPSVLLGALAVSTKHLGLALTSNVMQEHPVNFARKISTLDHISNGRIAWNIVTGTQDNGARNYGLPSLTDHAERYVWADEYVDVTYTLWEGSWDEGALLRDKDGGVFSDRTKVHKIHHDGPRYRVEGPHLPSPSRQQINEIRALAVAARRRPDDIKFFQGLTFVIGDTQEDAERTFAEYELYSSLDAVAGSVTDREPVVGDLASRVRGDSTLVIGTPEHIADELQRWQDAGVDGINVINWVIPGSFEDFAEKVLRDRVATGTAAGAESGTATIG